MKYLLLREIQSFNGCVCDGYLTPTVQIAQFSVCTSNGLLFILFQRCVQPFKDEAQTAVFKDPVRTAQ